MKKLTLILLIIMSIFTMTTLFAQATPAAPVTTDSLAAAADSAAQAAPIEEARQIGTLEMLARNIVGNSFVDLFIQGGFAMWPILILLIWALAVIIWKIVALSYARTNADKLLEKILPLIQDKKYSEAAQICASTRGPVATILHQGLLKANRGIEAVEKAVEGAASLEIAYLDKGFNPLGTTISLAPMFGFFGTLVGMIVAFEAIEQAGEVEATIVAGGIKIALITSVAGLAVAIPVQFFYNLFQTMVDGLIIDMQKSSEKLIETLVENKGE